MYPNGLYQRGLQGPFIRAGGGAEKWGCNGMIQ